MRVTSMMQNTQFLKNLRNTNMGLVDLENKLSTGERIHRPGDDPVGIGYQLRYTTELARNEQYLENAKTGYGWLSQTDSVLQQAQAVLQRLNTLTNQAATGTVTPEVREQIRLEVLQLREQMVTIGNSTYNGRHIFNGQKTDEKPYSIADAANESTDTGVYQLNVSSSVAVPVSITGEEVFGKPGAADNIFKLFDDIANQLDTNDQAGLSNSLERILGGIEKVSTSLAEAGARMNRFELIQDRISAEKLNLTELYTNVAGVDMPNAFMELQLKQNVLQASLAMGARISMMSMLDYLR